MQAYTLSPAAFARNRRHRQRNNRKPAFAFSITRVDELEALTDPWSTSSMSELFLRLCLLCPLIIHPLFR